MIQDHKRLSSYFFRSINSPELFKEFFDRFKAWDGFGLNEKPKNDAIHSAWIHSEHPKKREMEEALCCVNDLACEEAREWLYTVAGEVGLNVTDLSLAKLSLTLFLRHPTSFKKAYEYFSLEKLDNLKVFVGKQPVKCAPSAADLEQFKNDLRSVLKKAALGSRLRTDVGPHPPGKWVMVVPHENFVKPDQEFKTENEIITRERRPVYELVVIYHTDTGILKLRAGRGRRKAEAVADVFASAILGQGHAHFLIKDIVRFEPLFRPGFNFPRRPDDHFDWAQPAVMKFRPLSDPSWSIEIRCGDTHDGKRGVREQLAEMGYSLSNIKVESLDIQFQFPGGKKKRRTVTLTPPHRYTLDETARDRHLEEVLMRWGFIDLDAKGKAHEKEPAELVGQAV